MPKRDRSEDRTRRRLMVRYGIEKADRTAFTQNVSVSGIYLKTNAVMRPGTMLQLELELDRTRFSLWGEVVWAKRVPPQLAHVLDCGMGVRFVDPGPVWNRAFEAWVGG